MHETGTDLGFSSKFFTSFDLLKVLIRNYIFKDLILTLLKLEARANYFCSGVLFFARDRDRPCFQTKFFTSFDLLKSFDKKLYFQRFDFSLSKLEARANYFCGGVLFFARARDRPWFLSKFFTSFDLLKKSFAKKLHFQRFDFNFVKTRGSC